jgi:hypothetical protein
MNVIMKKCYINVWIKFRGLSPGANYTVRASDINEVMGCNTVYGKNMSVETWNKEGRET